MLYGGEPHTKKIISSKLHTILHNDKVKNSHFQIFENSFKRKPLPWSSNFSLGASCSLKSSLRSFCSGIRVHLWQTQGIGLGLESSCWLTVYVWAQTQELSLRNCQSSGLSQIWGRVKKKIFCCFERPQWPPSFIKWRLGITRSLPSIGWPLKLGKW